MLESTKKDFCFCLFLGFLGVHKFRKGKKELGVLYLCTIGLLGIGWLFDTMVCLIKYIRAKRKLNNYSYESIDETDYLPDGYSFEEYIAGLLNELDFESIEVTNNARDFGADIIAVKNDVRYAIQCKLYSQPVGITAVQEVFAAKVYYHCHIAVVLTNNFFTAPADELAEAVDVLLWDRLKLSQLIQKVKLRQ